MPVSTTILTVQPRRCCKEQKLLGVIITMILGFRKRKIQGKVLFSTLHRLAVKEFRYGGDKKEQILKFHKTLTEFLMQCL